MPVQLLVTVFQPVTVLLAGNPVMGLRDTPLRVTAHKDMVLKAAPNPTDLPATESPQLVTPAADPKVLRPLNSLRNRLANTAAKALAIATCAPANVARTGTLRSMLCGCGFAKITRP